MEFLQNVFGIIIPAIGYIIGIFSFFYYNKLRFFIFINRIFKRKKDVNFNIIFDFDGQFDNIKEIKEYFKKETSHEFKNISSSKRKEVFQLDNLIVKIEKSEFPYEEFVNTIFIKNSNSTYKMACKNVKTIQLIIKNILDNNGIKNKRYCFSSNFNKSNPFINKSITKVGINKIKHFYMILSTSVFTSELDNEEDIQINMNQASYVTDDFNDLRDVANIILAM